ncbi:MAG TPA: HlyD family efflux transporter periplasmic adaptor subunit [Gemmatimonadales bacterium]|nr:HlyD family efflux transporter periplasmic adaptor subunit [Gemmatimonadales bacterium]
MDVARPPQKRTGRNVLIGVGIVAAIVLGVFVLRLKPALPSVQADVTVIDSVRRSDMVREVRGPGTLTPEEIQFVPAQTTARVDKLDVQSGQVVKTGDILLEMSSPDAEIAMMQADQSLSQARAAFITLQSDLRNGILSQQGQVATTNTQYVTATQNEVMQDTLHKKGLAATFDVNNAHALAQELTTRLANEKERLQIMTQSADSQLVAARTNIDQLKGIAEFYHARQQSLVVRSPGPGVVQGLTLQPGEFVTEGTTLLKVVQPTRLKAVLRIPESGASDVQIGQSATIDTRSKGILAGHVTRKDPSSEGGTVGVDVSFDGPLPAGAVPDLSVDGVIQIEKLHDVLHVQRPGYGAGTGMVGLFKLVDNGRDAVRVQVVLGRSSVTDVEVIRGLSAGDKIITSDMSQYDGVDRVRITR